MADPPSHPDTGDHDWQPHTDAPNPGQRRVARVAIVVVVTLIVVMVVLHLTGVVGAGAHQ